VAQIPGLGAVDAIVNGVDRRKTPFLGCLECIEFSATFRPLPGEPGRAVPETTPVPGSRAGVSGTVIAVTLHWAARRMASLIGAERGSFAGLSTASSCLGVPNATGATRQGIEIT
jgi:hypothetical protein